MTEDVSDQGYSGVAIILHWIIAALILFNLAIGFVMEDLPPPGRFIVIGAHVSAGITVLALTVVRIGWRVTHRPPALPQSLAAWERLMARIAHAGLYVLMLALPLSGWALISANPPVGSVVALEQARQYEAAKDVGAPARPPLVSGIARLWWIVPLPSIAPLAEMGAEFSGVERQKELHDNLFKAHALGAYCFLLLLLMHVGGALKHRFLDGEDVLHRMGLQRPRRQH